MSTRDGRIVTLTGSHCIAGLGAAPEARCQKKDIKNGRPALTSVPSVPSKQEDFVGRFVLTPASSALSPPGSMF